MHASVIILAAGRGKRLGLDIPKPLVKVGLWPLVLYSLTTFNRHPLIKDIILVASSSVAKKAKRLVVNFKINKLLAIVRGGRHRQDSVISGLKCLPKDTDLVLIHDAARPFVSGNTITRLIRTAENYGVAVSGFPLTGTIKKVFKAKNGNFLVEKTIDRTTLWEAQTPQVFKREIIQEAIRRFKKFKVTDDAMWVERMKQPVVMVLGQRDNIKITYAQDLIIAQAIAKKRRLI